MKTVLPIGGTNSSFNFLGEKKTRDGFGFEGPLSVRLWEGCGNFAYDHILSGRFAVSWPPPCVSRFTCESGVSAFRFGSFEIFKSTDELTGRQGPSVGRNDIRAQLLDYVIETFYPEIQRGAADRAERNAAFFREVQHMTAPLLGPSGAHNCRYPQYV